MPANPYSIDFQPLSFGGLGEIADVYQRAAMNRDANALKTRQLDLQEKTLSAEEYRKGEEFKALQAEREFKKQEAKIAAYPAAVRMAQQSPELATGLFKGPHGFSFMKSQDLGAGEEGPQLSPNAPTDRPVAAPAPPPLPVHGEAGYQDPMSPAGQAAAMEQPDYTPPASPRMRLYAGLGMPGTGLTAEGAKPSPVEVPGSPQSPTGYGPKYDAIYEHALTASNGDTRYAFAEANKAKHDDDAMTGTAERQRLDDERGIAARTAHETFLATQAEKYRQTAAEQSRIDMARIVAMMAANTNKQGPSADALAALSAYANKNPNDTEGLYKLAGALGVVNPQAAITGIDKTSSATGEEKDRALRSKQGLRAVEGMEKSGYVPNREDTQKWLNNQRWVYMAKKDGVTGLFALGGQVMDVLPQSEVEGLSPQAAEYFANVRRLMEPLARAKSGAAISETEWVNFFNQYGPNSPGGLKAAKAELEEMRRLSGPAGRQLESGPTGSASNAAANGVPAGGEAIPGKVGPHGRPVYRKVVDGKTKLYEVD